MLRNENHGLGDDKTVKYKSIVVSWNKNVNNHCTVVEAKINWNVADGNANDSTVGDRTNTWSESECLSSSTATSQLTHSLTGGGWEWDTDSLQTLTTWNNDIALSTKNHNYAILESDQGRIGRQTTILYVILKLFCLEAGEHISFFVCWKINIFTVMIFAWRIIIITSFIHVLTREREMSVLPW